jgi:RNA-directed DNA polymerase
MKLSTEGRIQTTAIADNVISTRPHLAELLSEGPELISAIQRRPSDFYTKFTVPKPNGELRTIRPPRKVLRHIQRTLLQEFYRRVRVRSCLHGGIRGRSILTHAIPHVGRQMVATLDIRKFFPSTTCLHIEPIIKDLGFSDEAAEVILSLVMFDNELPQGAPTSSLLANLAFNAGDSSFIKICQKKKLRYTRYVDDIAISGDCDFSELRGPFVKAIESTNYSIANEKIHFMPQGVRQTITGLVVNERMRPTRKFVNNLNTTIRFCLEHGASLAAAIEGLSVRQLKNRLTGQVNYLLQSDSVLGKKMKGKLYGVDWRSQVKI